MCGSHCAERSSDSTASMNPAQLLLDDIKKYNNLPLRLAKFSKENRP